jgi:hypothetical protein
MPNDTQPTETGVRSATSHESRAANEITPELVRQVAERVYAMLLMDLRIERERGGENFSRPHLWKGGR